MFEMFVTLLILLIIGRLYYEYTHGIGEPAAAVHECAGRDQHHIYDDEDTDDA